jgi:hypothetical protein
MENNFLTNHRAHHLVASLSALPVLTHQHVIPVQGVNSSIRLSYSPDSHIDPLNPFME